MSETADNQTTTESKIKPEDIHMPPSSFWPIILAVGFILIIGGLAISVSFSIVGIIITLVSAIGWVIEPVDTEENH